MKVRGTARPSELPEQPPVAHPAGVSLVIADRVARRLMTSLAAVTVVLVVVGTAFAVLVPRPQSLLVDSAQRLVLLDGEANATSWWGSALLLLAALLLAAAAAQGATRTRRTCLGLISAGVVLLSLDETATLHERLTGILSAVDGGATSGDSPFWVVIATPVLLLALVSLRRLLPSLPRPVLRELLLALGALLLGAVVLEVVGSALFAEDTTGSLLVIGAEEGLEYTAALLACDAALKLLAPGAARQSSPSPLAHDVV